jgi:hypothetical protein
MTHSLLSRGSSPLPPLPPLPDFVFRRRLAAVRERLHDLEGCCPPGHAAGLADILEAVEGELASLGHAVPEAALTAHDLAVLAALGCPA